MKREVNLSEITDGKFYGLNDMVKVECNECLGCSACCRGMGSSILLDPLDLHRLMSNLEKSFEELLADKIELNLVEGLILPNLKMAGKEECCSFLNSEGRCSIHTFRPGICRLFPLGRYYENHSFQYILQVHGCVKENKTKTKVRKWIDTPDIAQNEQYIVDWHYFILEVQDLVKSTQEESRRKDISLYLLKLFFMKPYIKTEDFYLQFQERLAAAKDVLGLV
jgi:Fe-S-cluster containining protein